MFLGLGLRSLDGGDDQHGGVGLGGTGDHVLHEVTVTRGVDDGEVVLVGVEALVGDVDGDTSLPLFPQRVHDPCELEGALTLLFGHLLVLVDQVLLDVSGVGKHPAYRGGLAVVDVTDEH